MAILRVRVTPRASRSEVTGYRDGVLTVRVTAPPVEGKANKELVKVLADWFGVKKSQLVIAAGHKSRDKRLEVAGLSQAELDSLASRAADASEP